MKSDLESILFALLCQQGGAREVQPVRSKSQGLLFSLTISQMMVSLCYLSLPALLPFLTTDFSLSAAEAGFLTSSLLMGFVLILLPAGAVVDLWGPHRILLGGLTLAVLPLLLLSTVSFYGLLLLLFALVGAGRSCLEPATNKYIVLCFRWNERGRAMGFKQSSVPFGGFLAAVVLPSLAETWGWKSSLLVVASAALIWLILQLWMPRSVSASHPNANCDLTSADSLPAHTPVSGGSKLPPLATRGSLRGLLGDARLPLLAVGGACFGVGQFSIYTYWMLYTHESLGIPVSWAGGLLALIHLAGALGRIGLGFISDHWSGRQPQLLALMGTGSALFSFIIASLGGERLLAWPALVGLTLGLGFCGVGFHGVYLDLTSRLSGERLTGLATSLVVIPIILGGMIGAPLFGSIVDHASYPLAWGVLSSLFLIGTACFLTLQRSS